MTATDGDKYITMLSLAEGALDETGFADWLRRHIKIDTGRAVHEKPARYAR